MVRFDTNPERFASVSMLKKLESSIKESIKLDAQILTMDEEILVNPVNFGLASFSLVSDPTFLACLPDLNFSRNGPDKGLPDFDLRFLWILDLGFCWLYWLFT